MKVSKVARAAACIGIMASIGLMPMAAGASNFKGILNAATALDKTSAQIWTDLGNGSSNDTISALFITYSGECVLFATYGARYGSKLQLDILNVAKIGNGWAWTGYFTLNTPGVGVAAWKQASKDLFNVENQFARDVRGHR